MTDTGGDNTRTELTGTDRVQLGQIREVARLEDLNLSRALGLTQPQLDSACGNRWTWLPATLTVPPGLKQSKPAPVAV